MREITHTCGHTQQVDLDDKWKTWEKLKPGFIKRQIAFFSGYPCPTCYCRLKDAEHDLSMIDMEGG